MPSTIVRVAVLAVACLLLVGSSASAPQDGTARDQRLRGFVLPSRQVELDSPLEEILAEITVRESQRVAKDHILAVMDNRLQAVVVESARVRAESTAEVRQAELRLEDAQMSFDRLTDAFDRNAATDMEMRSSRIARDQAEAALTASRENQRLAAVNLKLEEERLERYRVRAPFDGTVIQIIAESGARLTDNDSIMLFADLDTLEAHLNLPVELYGRLELGRTYRLLADEPVNRVITGTLTMISPIIDTASRTFRCVFTIENENAVLPAGFVIYLQWE